MEEELQQFYAILGLTPEASPEEVKQAYRDLVKIWHPDRFPNDERLQQKAQEKIKEINSAYERLKARPPRPASQPKPRVRPSKAHARGSMSEAKKFEIPRSNKAQRISFRIVQGLVVSLSILTVGVLLKDLASALLTTPYSSRIISYFTQGRDREMGSVTLGDSTDQDEASALEGGNVPKQVAVVEKQIYMPPALPLAYFTVGSTRAEVVAIQGPPDSVTSEGLKYGTSEVLFQNGRVVGWENSYPRLKVRMLPAAPTNAAFFTIGSSKNEVLAAQGTPDRFSAYSFQYGTSEVVFQNGRVVSWKNDFPRLKAQMLPSSPTTLSRFTVGSTKDEVLAAQGTPDRFTGNIFHYGTSEVVFQNGRVVSWNNSFPRLRVRTSPEG